MLKSILTNPMVISAGVGVLIAVVVRIIDNKKLEAKAESLRNTLDGFGKKWGLALTQKGSSSKLGKAAYEKIENMFQNWGLCIAKGFFKKPGTPFFTEFNNALNSDDKKEK